MTAQTIAPASSPAAALAPRVRPILSQMPRLPVLPRNYTALCDVLRDPASGTSDIARIVGRDPALAARVLRLAGSAASGAQGPVSGLDDAIRIVGLSELKVIVLLSGFGDEWATVVRGPFRIEDLWTHSLHTGLTARNLARRLGAREDADLAYCAGLLHDLGKLILGAAFGAGYFSVVQTSCAQRRPLAEVERSEFGADHAEIAAYIFTAWKLPEAVITAVWHHHTPGRTGATQFSPATAVHLANLLEYRHAGPPAFIVSPADEAHLQTLGLPTSPDAWPELARA